MAVVANTVLTTDTVGNREELDNFVSMITPTDTPIHTMADGKRPPPSTLNGNMKTLTLWLTTPSRKATNIRSMP